MPNGTLTERRRVMVVQDDAHALKFADLLAADGYDVAIARDMADVLEILHDGRPDAVVLDLQLRAMGAMSVLQIIKTVHPHIPVVMIAASHLYELTLARLRAEVAVFLAEAG